MAKSTDVSQFLSELEGGTLEQKLGAVLSLVAAAVVDHNKAGEVTLKLKIKPVGNGNHVVTAAHQLKYTRPTMRGGQSEEESGATSMHVGTGGSMSFFPEKQGEMFGKAERQKQPDA